MTTIRFHLPGIIFTLLLFFLPLYSILTQSAIQRPATTHNPFDFTQLGLPYTPVYCGTGLPEHLGEKDIRAVVQRVFAEADLQWDTAHIWQDGDDQVLLDAYDPVSKIGFVYLHHFQLGAGTSTAKNHANGRIDRINMGEGDWLERQHQRFLRTKTRKNWQKSLKRSIDRCKRMDAPSKASYHRLVDEALTGSVEEQRTLENMLIQLYGMGNTLDYIEAMLAKAADLPLGPERSELIRRFSLLERQGQVSKISQNDPYYALLLEVRKLAFELAKKPYHYAGHPQKWVNINAVTDLVRRLRYVNHPDFVADIENAILAASDGEWEPLQQLQRIRNPIMASLGEIKKMTSPKNAGQDRIMVMNYNSQITVVPGSNAYYREPIPAEVFAGLPNKSAMKALPEDERKAARRAYFERSQDYRNKQREQLMQQQILVVEQQVRDFIQSAKQATKF
ncbi:MAG: hypothetical protein AAF828_02580 [Bacteroidota bacterium]